MKKFNHLNILVKVKLFISYDTFENMSAIILTQISQNFYSFCYFGIESDSFYFQIKNYQWQI